METLPQEAEGGPQATRVPNGGRDSSNGSPVRASPGSAGDGERETAAQEGVAGELVDFLLLEALRVAASVPALVGLHDGLADPVKGLAERLHHPFRFDGVAAQHFFHLIAELPGVHGIRGNGQHADVVHDTPQSERHTPTFVAIHLQVQENGEDSNVGAALRQ